MTNLISLAERVEAMVAAEVAYWSSRKLEVEILAEMDPDHEAVGILTNKQFSEHTVWEWTSGGVAWQSGCCSASIPVPRFLASLEAAMLLVTRWLPSNHDVCIETVDGRHYASVNPAGRSIDERIMGPVEAATLATALTAAALRAHAAGERS